MPKYNSISDAPFSVQKRYFQVKFSKYVIYINRLYLHKYLTLKEFRKNRLLSNILETYKIEMKKTYMFSNECVKKLMNLGLYCLIAEKDIQTVKIDALTHPNSWKRSLSLRIILLTIYEWDMSKVGSNDFKMLLSQSSVDNELQQEFFKALRLLRKSQKDAAKLLRFARNATIAHRDSDALLQLETIESLNTKEVMSITEEFYISVSVFSDVFSKVLLQAGSMNGLYSFMLNSKNK
jgi:hypothetical protein